MSLTINIKNMYSVLSVETVEEKDMGSNVSSESPITPLRKSHIPISSNFT